MRGRAAARFFQKTLTLRSSSMASNVLHGRRAKRVPGAILVRPLVPDKRADALTVILLVQKGFAAMHCWIADVAPRNASADFLCTFGQHERFHNPSAKARYWIGDDRKQ
jgi:hypothetical protein